MNKHFREKLFSVLHREITADQEQQLLLFMSAIAEGNQRVNLTTISAEQSFYRHILDSAHLLSILSNENFTLIDIGTGAGIPGLPIRILQPECSLTLVDSSLRKVDFLKTVCAKLKLNNVHCIHGRAEELSHDSLFREQFEICTARGLRSLPELLELCSGFVAPGGSLYALKGEGTTFEQKAAHQVLHRLSLEEQEQHDYLLEPGRTHHIYCYRKLTPLAAELPRLWKKITTSSLD